MGKGEIGYRDDPEAFARVLGEALRALEKVEIEAVVFGSIAANEYGRPEDPEDVDVLVRAADADAGLDALGRAGFATDKAEPGWLCKAERDGVLVDLIFRAVEVVQLDDDVLEHARHIEFLGVDVPIVSPEDQLVIEALGTKVEVPEHWFIGLSILARTELDWAYLERRARLGPKRMLSFATFADSHDLPVPRDAVERLYRLAYR